MKPLAIVVPPDERFDVGAQVIEISRIKTVRDREQFAVDEVKAAGGTLELDRATERLARSEANLAG